LGVACRHPPSVPTCFTCWSLRPTDASSARIYRRGRWAQVSIPLCGRGGGSTTPPQRASIGGAGGHRSPFRSADVGWFHYASSARIYRRGRWARVSIPLCGRGVVPLRLLSAHL
jgi:hypothetical protein